MSLHLVVDNTRSWLNPPPELEERARARQAAIDAITRPRVLAFRATREAQRFGSSVVPLDARAAPDAVTYPGRRECSPGPHPLVVAIAAALGACLIAFLTGGFL